MTNRKIDRTLEERHSLLNLLEKLNGEAITVGEMDDIGMKLQKAGKQALPPLVRKLWREKSGDIISRYAYLLDFFDDEAWLDQLIRITLTRNDLEIDAKSALLAALESYGIDVTAPPFSRILGEVGGPLKLTLPRVLAKGDQGYILFMEDFCSYPVEVQCALVGELPEVDDPRIFPLFEMLLGYDRPEVVREVLATLGKTRNQRSVPLLRRFIDYGDPALRDVAVRSLKRLGFLGFSPDDVAPFPYQDHFHGTFVTPFDGSGNRSLWISRQRRDELRYDVLFIQLHESGGMLDAVSYGGLGADEYAMLLKEAGDEDRLLPVSATYAVRLVRDGIYLCGQHETDLPAEYLVRSPLFGDQNMTPQLLLPDFDPGNLERIALAPRYLRESATLLDESLFDDWFMANPTVYDLAEEWGKAMTASMLRVREHSALARKLIEQFCREVITPERERIVRRLFLTADLMNETGVERDQIERTLAVALSISGSQLPAHAHPFLRRLALESLEAAREAMAEGYDLRTDPYMSNFDE